MEMQAHEKNKCEQKRRDEHENGERIQKYKTDGKRKR